MTLNGHLRGIVIAGVLAAVALALGFATLSMNRTAAPAEPHTILPLKLRHHATAANTKLAAVRTTGTSSKAKHGVATARKSVPHVKPRPRVDANYTAAKKAGLPASVARALASRPVAVVTFSSHDDPLAQLASGEAKTGAARAGAAFVVVSVDRDGGAVQSLTRLLGALPASPTTLVYTRPAALVTTLTGFNDRTVVEQAAASAATYDPVPAR